MTELLITNGRVITGGAATDIASGQAIYIKDGFIADKGPERKLLETYKGAPLLDAAGQLVMPGNICAHTHFYGAFARGMAIPGDAPKDFPEILEKLWWRLDKALTLDDVRYSALVCLIDAVKHGTTTLVDHHASPNAIDGSLDIIAEAVKESGLRACLCYEVTDRDGPEKMRAGIRENMRFLEKRAKSPDDQLAGTFGLHASLTLSDESLTACRDAAPAGQGFHVHVAEHEVDEYDSLKRSGVRAIERLGRFAILGPKTITAHCVHIDYEEARLLKETGTWVSHQPRSNMNNAVGAAQIEALGRLGVRVCLGNDGFSNAMWEEWKAAYFLHKIASRDPRRGNGGFIAEMAGVNNAELAGQFFGLRLGVLEPGAAADIILVDYQATTPLSGGNLPWHIIFGFESSMVTTTICRGQLLMKDRKLLFLDEAAITAKSRELAAGVWERYNRLF